MDGWMEGCMNKLDGKKINEIINEKLPCQRMETCAKILNK
jgi:hypothetical protein